MQILNISTTVRPSDSLTTRMFPVVTSVPVVYNTMGASVTIKTLVWDGTHDIQVRYNVSGSVVLREPLITVNVPDPTKVVFNTLGATVTLRTTLQSISITDPVAKVTFNTLGATVKIHTVLVAHSQTEPLQSVVFNTLSASVKLT